VPCNARCTANVTTQPTKPEGHEEVQLDVGPYGLRGEHTPPLVRMFGGYGIIFGALILLPLVLFLVVRFVIL
jgi:hypothetical protein